MSKKPEKVEYQFHQPEPKKSFSEMIYSKQDGTYFGRTSKSWGQLLIFYTIFYIVLAALFAICMQGLLSTLDGGEPKWKLESSLIGTNPGLGFRPLSEQTERGGVIRFDGRKGAEVDYWVELLNDFLRPYNYTLGTEKKLCSFSEKHNSTDVCLVDIDSFGPCSAKNHYGYKDKKPCIFLKLNKIFAWEPKYYDDPEMLPEDMPQSLKKVINGTSELERKKIWVSCSGHLGKDKENFESVSFYPSQGFPAYYYPFNNQPGYLSPLVAVQFPLPPKSSMLDVECRAWARNIIYSGSIRDRMGSVTFQILLE